MVVPDAKLMYRTSRSVNDPVIKSMIRSVIDQTPNQSTDSTGVMDGLTAFYYAVDWIGNLSFFLPLFGFHISLLLLSIIYRKNPITQFIILSLMLLAVLLSQSINHWCMSHWSDLGLTDSYFDENGVFISFIWSAPLALIGLFNAAMLLMYTSQLMVVVKRKQLQVQRDKKQSTDQAATPAISQADKQAMRRRNAEANKHHNKFVLD